jgi:hypothetical protein
MQDRERTYLKTVRAKFDVLPRHLLGRTEENHI